jgi:hypothetical protein
MRPQRYLVPAILGTALLAAAGIGVHQASAHHAFAAEFDGNLPVMLRGKVTKIEWINPHAWVHLAAVQPNGSTTPWMVEGGTPNTLLRQGINRNTLKIGTEIVVRGFQSKDKLCNPTCRANGRDLTFADGRKLFMGSSGTGAPKDGSEPNS